MGTEAAQPKRERQWDGIVRREIAVELRAVDDDTRALEVIASSEAMDSHGDVIRQHWDLSRYELNPVVLWNHNIFESSRFAMGGAVDPEDVMPVGKAVSVGVKSKKLQAKIELVKGTAEEEPFIDKLWRRIQQGVIRGVSVGFRPGSVTAIKDKAGNTKYYELGSEEFPNELLELSLVPIGSNPQAVAKSIAFEREHLGRMAAGNDAGDGEETSTMAMTDEEKKAIDKAQADTKAALELAQKAEADLKAEKALAEKLAGELKAANERAAQAEAGVAKAELDARSGKKFAPAERAELDELCKDIGLQRVLKLIDARPDIALTKGAEINGKPLAGTQQPAPEPTKPGGASAELSRGAQEAASKAVA